MSVLSPGLMSAAQMNRPLLRRLCSTGPSSPYSFPEEFINRNPRNLERLRLAKKRQGWALEPDSRLFWHRIVFEPSGRHTAARLEHNSGRVVLTASTREPGVRRQLASATDVAAAASIGRVLGRRCLEAGLTEVDFTVSEEQLQRSEKLYRFVEGLRSEGVVLEEPSRIVPEPWWSKHREQKPWDLTEDQVVGEAAASEPAPAGQTQDSAAK